MQETCTTRRPRACFVPCPRRMPLLPDTCPYGFSCIVHTCVRSGELNQEARGIPGGLFALTSLHHKPVAALGSGIPEAPGSGRNLMGCSLCVFLPGESR